MTTDDASLLDVWQKKWEDLVEFEIVPVRDSPTKAAQRGG